MKSLDLVVLLKIAAGEGAPWTQMRLAATLLMSSRSVNEALRRAEAVRLYDPGDRQVNVRGLEEVLFHGIKYFFPITRGSLTRGMPTGWAAPPLCGLLAKTTEPPPVWPYWDGTARGVAVKPLHPSVPDVCVLDPGLYELLAMVDTLRDGSARERALAEREMSARLRR